MYEKFIARQPIFDEKLKIFAYELLFRAGSQNVFQPRKEASSSGKEEKLLAACSAPVPCGPDQTGPGV